MLFSEMDHPDNVVDQHGDEYTYEYFIFSDDIPVRMWLSKQGRKLYAEALRWQSQEIEKAYNYVHLFNNSPEADFHEVTKEEFYKACDDYLASWTPERIKRAERNMEALNRMIKEEKS